MLGAVFVGDAGPFGVRHGHAADLGDDADGMLETVSTIEDATAAYERWDQDYEDMIAAERDAEFVPCPAGEHWITAYDPDSSGAPCPCFVAC